MFCLLNVNYVKTKAIWEQNNIVKLFGNKSRIHKLKIIAMLEKSQPTENKNVTRHSHLEQRFAFLFFYFENYFKSCHGELPYHLKWIRYQGISPYNNSNISKLLKGQLQFIVRVNDIKKNTKINDSASRRRQVHNYICYITLENTCVALSLPCQLDIMT